MFCVDPSAGFYPAIVRDQRKQFFQPGLSERWIHEQDVEGFGRGLGQVGVDVLADYFSLFGFQQSQVAAQGLGEGRGVVDEDGCAGAAGEGFKAEGAGAGEEIEAAAAGEVMGQPVEEGLAGACGGWAYAACVGEAQFAAAPVAADDAEFAAVAGWPGFLGARHGD